MCRELLYKNKIRIVSIKLLCKIVDVPRVNLEPYKLLKFWNQNLYKMDEIYKIATNEDTIPLFDLRSMIHYSMGTPLPKTKIRLTNYTPKYPSKF